MDQQQLRDLEAKCVQELSPQCKAGCPLHVDARSLCASLATGDFDAAWQVLLKTLPLPGVLARICDGPCRQQCLRGKAGDPVQIHLLERSVAQRPRPRQRSLAMPARDKAVAVAGSGLSGLVLASDLKRKGYTVTLFEPGPRLGHPLYGRFGELLPDAAIDEEMSALEDAGVVVHTGAEVSDGAFMDGALASFDALYLCLDAGLEVAWPLRMEQGAPVYDEMLGTTSLSRVLAGGDSASPVERAAQGRRAANTIDRLLQGVSLSAERSDQGAYRSRLYTSLAKVPSLPAVVPADPIEGFSPQQAAYEAERCLQCECLECVKACAYLAHYKGYPKTYARQIYNNLAIVKGHRQANQLINSCMLCGQCSALCPHDFPMAELCLETRQSMVAEGIMPPSAFDFALEDLRFSSSSEFFLFRHAPGRDASTYLLFPGCQLCASSPGHVEVLYQWLRENVSQATGLGLGCCGVPAHWAGERGCFERELDRVRQEWERLGKPTIITACATCLSTFQEYAPDVAVAGLWNIMTGYLSPGDASPRGAKKPVAVHDPCAARHNPVLRHSARRLLSHTGVKVRELELAHEQTSCCGYGGLMYSSNPALAKKVAEKRVSESKADFVAYCAMCRDNLAATGKRVYHLLDLLFPEAAKSHLPPGNSKSNNSAQEDPAARPAPGFSQRQENKADLRRRLLKTLWQEEPPPMQAHQHLDLVMEPGLQELLEERRILLNDLRRVILHAERTGQKLADAKTGRFLAYHQPVRVTYWVEYAPEGESFRVYNAYSHRMTIPGGPA